jgi:hypothetical protein
VQNRRVVSQPEMAAAYLNVLSIAGGPDETCLPGHNRV